LLSLAQTLTISKPNISPHLAEKMQDRPTVKIYRKNGTDNTEDDHLQQSLALQKNLMF